MTNVTVSETKYNVTIAETNQNVTTTSTGAINVSVNATDLATSITNAGGGAEVLKSLENNVLTARTITANTEGDIVVSTVGDNIDLALSDNIEVASLNVSGTITNTGSGVANFATANINGTLTAGNIDGASTIDGTGNITITPGSSNFVHVNTNLSVGNTSTPQGVEILESSIGKTSGSATDITFTGKFNGDLTAGTTNISGHLIPVTDDTHDLGSSSKRFRDLYLGPGSLFINNQKVLEDDSGTIKVSSTNNLTVEAGGDLTLLSSNGTTSLTDSTILLNPSTGTSSTTVRGTLEAPDLHVGDLELEATLINNTGSNANLEIRTNGTGFTHINTADLYVGPLSGAVKIDENSIGVTAGTLTVTGNLVGNVTGQVSDLSNKSTSDLSEGTNLYFTNARADARVNNAILDEDDFSSDSATKVPTQQSTKAYIASQIQTKDNTDEITEGSSNLYFTDARARAAISEDSTQLSYNSSTGVLSYTQGNTDTVAEGSSNLYHTSARAISAVEGESTLDLSGAVTVTGQLTANDIIKVDDGFILTAFNPYGAGSNMPTTIMGVGQEDGWAGVHVRNRGQHDFGLGSGLNFSPRALMVMSAGRKDGSNNDDYLDSGDEFGVVSFNPYSGYKTGAEWLTGSVEISAIATENHSATGLGSKLRIGTTENGEEAGATESSHVSKTIDIHGTTITTSDTLKIDDDLTVTGNIGNEGSAVDFDDNIKVTGNVSSKITTIGDFDSSGSPAYSMSGIQINSGDVAWPTITFKEFAGTDGGGNKPVNLFTNPGFETEVFGGTPASPAALGDAKRIIVVNGNAANGSSLPGTANIRILGKTVGVQSGSNRGTEFIVETTPSNSTATMESIKVIANKLIIGDSGHDSGNAIISANGGDLKLDDRLDTNNNNIINSGGDVTIDDNLKVNTNLTVDGNTQLGNANTDTVTCTAKLTASNGFVNTILDTATANTLAGMGIIDEGAQAYISDGNAGGKCMAFYDGSNWKKMHDPTANISSS